MKISGRICDSTGGPANGVQIKVPGVGDFQVDSTYSIEVTGPINPNNLNFASASAGRLVCQVPTTGDFVCNVVLKAGGGGISWAQAQNEFKGVYKGESVNENTVTNAPGSPSSAKFPAWLIPVAIVVLVVVFWKIKTIFKKS